MDSKSDQGMLKDKPISPNSSRHLTSSSRYPYDHFPMLVPSRSS